MTDPINILTGEQHLFDGTGSQTGTDSRWGDYSDLTIDPVGECNFYYTNEYLRHDVQLQLAHAYRVLQVYRVLPGATRHCALCRDRL